MMQISTAVPSQQLALVNDTQGFGDALANSSDLGANTILVSGWGQLAVCILIVVLCCCCTLLCLCTSCICCTNNVEEGQGDVDRGNASVISDKPPSYDEALRTSQSRNGLPSYQEALRRESQISWIQLPWSLQSPWTPNYQR